MNASVNYLDGNAAAGELSTIFAMDVTTAEGQCGNCGAKQRFAELGRRQVEGGIIRSVMMQLARTHRMFR